MTIPESATQSLLEVSGLAKSFGNISALRNVSFALRPGSVLALLGDNGAGKSTLIKLLNGLFQPDRGEIRWAGSPVKLSSPADAHALGIATVFQDLALVDALSIYRNMFLGREDHITRRFGPLRYLDVQHARKLSQQVMHDMGIRIRSANEPVASLSGGERQSIAIARGVLFSAKLLILDEPTSALSLKQTSRVLETIGRVRDKGISVIVISHNVHHALSIADQFVILSHGRSIATFDAGAYSREEISQLIIEGQFTKEKELIANG